MYQLKSPGGALIATSAEAILYDLAQSGWRVGRDVIVDADRVMSVSTGPRTVVSRTEWYGLFTSPEEAMIRIAASEAVTPAALAAADPAEAQRLMAVASLAVMLRRTDALEPSQTIDLANLQVQAGLDLLLTMGLISAARRDEIAAGVID